MDDKLTDADNMVNIILIVCFFISEIQKRAISLYD